MKVRFEIDCTPTEAREFLGLPDVRELQAQITQRLEERFLKNIDSLSPQEMFQSWFTLNANGAKQIQDLFSNFLVRPSASTSVSRQDSSDS